MLSPKLQLPLAHAEYGRKMAQERSVSNRDVWKLLSHSCWKYGEKGSKTAGKYSEDTTFSSCSISTAVIKLPYTFTESLRIVSISMFPLTVLNTYFQNIFNKSEQQSQIKANWALRPSLKCSAFLFLPCFSLIFFFFYSRSMLLGLLLQLLGKKNKKKN